MAQLCIRPKGDPHCPFHPKQNVILRCKDCPGQTLVCQLCITSIHEGHKFGNIQDDITEKIANIQQFITKTETLTMPQLVAEISSISKKKKTTSDMFQSEIQAARGQAEKLRELVDLHMTKIVSSLESDMKDTITSLDHYQRELEQSKSKLEAEIKDTKQTLASDSNILILDVEADIMKRSDDCIPPGPDISVPQFKPCKNPLQYVEKAFGDLEMKKTIPNKRKSKEVTTTMPPVATGSSQHQPTMPSHADKVVKPKVEHQTRKLLKKPVQLTTIKWRNEISSVCTTPNSMALVYTYQDKRLDLINDKGEVQKTLTLDTDVYRICLHPDTGDLYGCCMEDKSIRHINIQSKGKAKTTVLFHTDSIPWSIACTSNNVIVGMDWKVCMYTYKGQLVYSKDIGRYYTAFYLSVCNRTNRVAVACGHKVLVLDNNLQELYRYIGEGAAAAAGGVKRQMFNTYSIVYDDNGYLLTGDYDNKEIHILDDTAKYISTIKIKEVTKVDSLGARDGVLWVGSEESKEYRMVIIKYMD